MFFLYNIAALLWAVFILIICLLPGNTLPDISFWNFLHPDKLAHFFLYVVLSYLLVRGFKKQFTFPRLQNFAFVTAIICCILYGVFIEFLQHYFVAGRKGDVYDLLADVGGAVAGTIFFRYYSGKTKIA